MIRAIFIFLVGAITGTACQPHDAYGKTQMTMMALTVDLELMELRHGCLPESELRSVSDYAKIASGEDIRSTEDAWGNEMLIEVRSEQGRGIATLSSTGPDGVHLTSDDIIETITLHKAPCDD